MQFGVALISFYPLKIVSSRSGEVEIIPTFTFVISSIFSIYLFSKALNFEISKDDILNKKPFLFFKNEDEKVYQYLDKNRKNILLVVGASWKSKMYSKEKFVKIVQNLKENFFIAWGNEEEKEIAQFICYNSDANVLPKIDLNTLKALIRKVVS